MAWRKRLIESLYPTQASRHPLAGKVPLGGITQHLLPVRQNRSLDSIPAGMRCRGARLRRK